MWFIILLSIKSLDVSLQPVRIGDSMVTKQLIATAIVRDEKSGRDFTLTHRERAFTGTLSAFVTATGETATREVRTGDLFKVGEATYRVEKVQLTPPAAEIVKESPSLAQPERQILLPHEAETPEIPDAPERAATT